jgi:hypothetical protein
MGNCTGVFGACVGEDNQAVKKIDKEKMQLALAANNDPSGGPMVDGTNVGYRSNENRQGNNYGHSMATGL